MKSILALPTTLKKGTVSGIPSTFLLILYLCLCMKLNELALHYSTCIYCREVFLQRSVNKLLIKELENGGFVPQPPTASKNSESFSLFKDCCDPSPLASCLIGTSHGLLGQQNLIGKGEADGKRAQER